MTDPAVPHVTCYTARGIHFSHSPSLARDPPRNRVVSRGSQATRSGRVSVGKQGTEQNHF